jgi:MoaA/NifB/PqqE/SkfB family radical SAM enzyme
VDELDTDQIKAVIEEARSLGVLEIIFSGGEPLLRNDIMELIQYARSRGLITRLNSNGLLLTPERIAQLKAAGLSRCSVSIDHPDPETHDRLRKFPGLYRKAVEGIGNLIKAGIPCQIQTYASRQTIDSGLKEIIGLGKRLGVVGVFILFPIASGRWEGAFDEVLTEEERGKVRALQDLKCVHLELPTPGKPCCLFTRSILYVSPQGDVSPCPFMPYRLGNIKAQPLRELWYAHCAGLDFELRGDCPLNDPDLRERVREHVESVQSGFTHDGTSAEVPS